MAAASTCSANVTCLTAAAVRRHTLTVQIQDRRALEGVRLGPDASSETHMCILSCILGLAVFSGDTLSGLDSCSEHVCLRPSLHMHACKLLQICIHTDMNTLMI